MSETSARATEVETDSSDPTIPESSDDLIPLADRLIPDESRRSDPLIEIAPRSGLVSLRLREIWEYRELFYFLTWRDIKVRYKQTVLGAAWAIIQPLFTMLIFTLFFGKLAKVPSDGIPYPIFAYAGILPWTFFANAVTNSGNSLVGSSQLITKVYFPRLVIPGAAVLAGLVDFAVAFGVLLLLMGYYRVVPTWHGLMFVPLVALTTLFALGVGLWMSALNVRFRDIRYALPFAIQLGMFVTPVIYPSSIVPDRFRWLILLNPLTGIIGAFRSALLGMPFDWGALAVSTILAMAVFVFALYEFRRMEHQFADIV